MAKVNISRDQLLDHLRDNVQFLKLSSASFDLGCHEEAKRLAVTIRVLVYDTNRSKSILEQLGLKRGKNFYDTSYKLNPKNIIEHTGLLRVATSTSGITYVAPLSKSSEMPSCSNKFISFSDWWNEIVLKDNKGITYTRGQIVLVLANKDGGAHVDPKIDEDFIALKDSARTSLSFVNKNKGEEIVDPIRNVHLFSVRQMAYELLVSIEKMIL